MKNTEKEYLVTARLTCQVANDEWERLNENIKINSRTTVEDIFKWAELKEVDKKTIRIYPLESIENIELSPKPLNPSF